MTTPLRNKVASTLFLLLGLALGPVLGIWLNSAFGFGPFAILAVTVVYGVMVGVLSWFVYYELEELGAHRREEADLRRVDEMVSKALRENGYRP